MVESGRKHGPFDARCAVGRKVATPAWDVEREVVGRNVDRRATLGWYEFSARFFPNRDRHDFNALAGYEVYRKSFLRAPLRDVPTS
jgi:hypothetical protein